MRHIHQAFLRVATVYLKITQKQKTGQLKYFSHETVSKTFAAKQFDIKTACISFDYL